MKKNDPNDRHGSALPKQPLAVNQYGQVQKVKVQKSKWYKRMKISVKPTDYLCFGKLTCEEYSTEGFSLKQILLERLQL